VRVALAGKGGAGKTTLTATLARLSARDGHRVLCIDADSNPNLASALGIDADAPVPVLPSSIVSRRLDGSALREPVEDVLAVHALAGPDGIQLAAMGMPGHAEEGCLCSAHAVVRATLADLGGQRRRTFLDLEASPEHFSRGTARHVDAMVLVAEPYYRSLETVRRMAGLAAELPIARVVVIANKLRDPEDDEAITDFCRRHALDLVGRVPFDEDVLDADRDRVPLIDRSPDGDAVRAIGEALQRLTSAGAGSRTRTPTSAADPRAGGARPPAGPRR
jgi:CO dehydrogenase maturation factor